MTDFCVIKEERCESVVKYQFKFVNSFLKSRLSSISTSTKTYLKYLDIIRDNIITNFWSNLIMSTQISIFESAHKGDFDLVRSKLEDDPALLNKQDENKRILSHWACVGGNVKLVSYLIELGSSIDALDDNDNSPLILASSAGHYEVVCLLVENRCNVNQKTSSGHSALQYAASKNWLEICRKLLENKADINIADIRNATPLHRAASKGNTKIVEFLLTFDELDVDLRDSYGNTPSHSACEEDRQREAKLLVEHGASLDVRNAEKKTPLDLCSRALFRLLTNK